MGVTLGGPLYRWSPPHKITHAGIVCDLGARFRLRGRPVVPDVNQRAVIEDVYAEDSPGIPTCFSVGLVGPRQTIGKTTTLGLCAIADLVIFDVELHLWTAHRSFAATAAFRLMRSMIRSDPDTRALFKWPPNSGKGQEVLETLDGRRIVFLSRQNASGRSETATKITVDEALFAGADDIGAILPTLVTVPDAQVRYASSGGLGSSEFLRGLRDAGRAGGDPRRAWHEFGADFRECATDGCGHPIEDPGCALNDRTLWMQASPAERSSEADILDLRKEMPPHEFAREMLTWWDEPDEAQHPIDPEAWKRAGIDKESPNAQVVLDPIAIAVACSQDRSMSTVGVAGRRPDGKAQVELAHRQRGTGRVVEWVRERNEKRRPVAVVINPASPAGFLAEKLRQAGVEVWEPTAREFAQGCDDFRTTVNESKVTDPETGEVRPSELVHTRDVVLTSAVHAVEAKANGSWDPESEKADISALDAATLALMGLHRPGGPNVFMPRKRERATLVVGPLAAQWAAANEPSATTAEDMAAWERDRFRKAHAARVVVVLDEYADFRPSKYGKEELVTIGG